MNNPLHQLLRKAPARPQEEESGERGGALVTIAFLASYALLPLAALWPSAWAFGGLALISYLVELRISPYLVRVLSQSAAGLTLRFVIREIALLVLLARLGDPDATWYIVFAAGLVGLHGLRALHSSLALYVVRRRRLPVVTRGIDLAELRIPDAPPRLLAERHVRTLLHLDVFPLAGAVAGAVAGSAAGPALLGLAVAYGLALVAIAATAWHAWRSRHLGDEQRVLDVVAERVRELRPEVVLYFSGALDMAYQINMWLSTLDRLDRRTLIVLRERGMVDLLDRTSAPVLCLPRAQTMMNFPMPASVRVALYSANAGNNIHMLRIPGIKHVFINHGDSDKTASFNPFSKVYDEVWVAGPAGRDRYRQADIGVRDDEIVEVGRPQLAEVAVGRQTPDPMFTVLYAPTWEGWSDDLLHSSVSGMGPGLVRMLLDHRPEVRVLYKPHPLTGVRDPAAVKAHEEIVAMIDRANAERTVSGGFPPAEGGEAAAARLDELSRRLTALSTAATGAGGGDEAQASRDSARIDTTRLAAWQEARTSWSEAFWLAGGWWRHRAITAAEPHLYECFNRCDLLITDISSVASDFIASGKPFAVTNAAGLAGAEFRALFPTAATGAYLLDPGCAQLPEILAEARGEGPDRLAAERGAHKTYLLGAEGEDAFARFNDAVNRLAETSRVLH
ncbi:MAG TPA: hypothetical protein VH912_12165 [Streptosporangiaceae bacterium]|jgi:hypothetical protein